MKKFLYQPTLLFNVKKRVAITNILSLFHYRYKNGGKLGLSPPKLLVATSLQILRLNY